MIKGKSIQNNILKQKEYIINLFSNAIQEQRQSGKQNQQGMTFHQDDLNEAIDLITNLWSLNQQLQEGVANQISEDDYNSIKNIQKIEGPYSSIIVHQDNQLYQDMQMRLQAKDEEIGQLKEILYNVDQSEIQQLQDIEQNQLNNLLDDYLNQFLENKNPEFKDVLSEINKKIIILDNMIKKSSIVSNKSPSDQQQISEDSFNLTQEQVNQENQQIKQDQSFVSDSNSKKGSEIESLKSLKTLLKVVAKILKDNSDKQKDLLELKIQIIDLKKTVSEQQATIAHLQKLKRIQKYEEILENQTSKNKKSSEVKEEDIIHIFPKIQREQAQIIKLTKQLETNQPQTPEKPIENQKTNKKAKKQIDQPSAVDALKQIETSSKIMLDEASKLFHRAKDIYYEKFQKISQQQDYKNFILMAILGPAQHQKELSQLLTLDLINQMWNELNLSQKSYNRTIVQIMKNQQKSFFVHEKEWSLDELEYSNLLLNDCIESLRSQLTFIKSFNINNMETKQNYLNRLYFIENEIEKKSLNQVKSNIQLIIDSLK